MLLTPVKTLSYRATRTWVRLSSQHGPYIYTICDREVINNKPHITLKSFRQQAPPPQQSPLATLFGMMGPVKENDDDDGEA